MDRYVTSGFMTLAGAVRHPGERLTQADLAGCDIPRLLKAGAIVPDGRIGDPVTRAGEATREELLEEIARLQAVKFGFPGDHEDNPADTPRAGGVRRFDTAAPHTKPGRAEPIRRGEAGFDRGELRAEPQRLPPGQTLETLPPSSNFAEELARLRQDIVQDVRALLNEFGKQAGTDGDDEIRHLKADLLSTQDIAAQLKRECDTLRAELAKHEKPKKK